MQHSSRFLLGALALCAASALAQPEIKPINGLPYPVVSPEEATRLANIETIKLHLRDVTIKQALEEVGKQTGVNFDFRFGGGENLDKKLSLDIETYSFKEATDAIFEEADVRASLQKMGRGNVWGVVLGNAQPATKGPVSGKFPFQLRLEGLTTNITRQIQLDKTPIRNETASLSTNFSFDTPPQMPLVAPPRIEITRAEDDQGRSLVNNNRMPLFNNDVNFVMPVQLRAPEKGAKEIAHLDIKATYLLATKKETWEVPDILNTKDAGHDFQSGNNKVRVSILSVRKTNDSIDIDLQIKSITPLQGGFGEPSHPLLQLNRLSSAIQVIDANGKALSTAGFSGGGGGGELKGRMSYGFPRVWMNQRLNEGGVNTPPAPSLAEPLKLTIESPTEIVQVPVPFSFTNIPLP